MIDLAASSGVADSARAGGVVFLASSDLLGTVRRCLADVKSSPVPAVDGALEIVSALARVKGEFEPYTLQLLPAILERLQDKAASSKAAATAAATGAFAALLCARARGRRCCCRAAAADCGVRTRCARLLRCARWGQRASRLSPRRSAAALSAQSLSTLRRLPHPLRAGPAPARRLVSPLPPPRPALPLSPARALSLALAQPSSPT